MRLPTVRLASLALAGLLLAASPLAAEPLPADPLRSVMWEDMAARFLQGARVVFDDRVRVTAPASAENQMMVPVTVDARALPDVVEIVAIADLNPIPKILTFRPEGAEPFLAFRLKLEQASPVRVAARTADGTWHVAGLWVDAAGGGCTAPAAAHGQANWMRTLGETSALVRRLDDATARVAVRMRHPMDTGLAPGIPVFHLDSLDMSSGGRVLARLELFEPVSEDPVLTLLPRVGPGDEAIDVAARDTEGNSFSYRLDLPRGTSF